MIVYIVTTWLFLGLISMICILTEVKRNEEYVSIGDFALSLLAIPFGLIAVIYCMCELKIFKGFWNKKLF